MTQTTLDIPLETDLSPLTIIRTETALSRFPVHRMAKKGTVQIEIKNQSSAILWEVTYNSKYGQPGPLAYKLDTIVINRYIDRCDRPIPKVLRLGSLLQIAQELGLKRDTNSVKTALLQNAFAAIKAKLTYQGADRRERTLEAAFTRYSVVFTGEQLPGGETADGVYLILNDVYLEVLNAAITRPLDYEYMKELPPAAQRFYEIISYQIYAALYFNNERARLRYSEYCLLSTATRYFNFDQVKKQMYKVHRPHIQHGYISRVSFEATTDPAGKPDWWMYYIPGPHADREFREFTGKRLKAKGTTKSRSVPSSDGVLALPFPDTAPTETPENQTGDKPAPQLLSVVPETVEPTVIPSTAGTGAAEKDTSKKAAPVHSAWSARKGAPADAQEKPEETDARTIALIEQLVDAGLNRSTAAQFAREKPEECHRQLEFLPFVTTFKSSRGAYLRRAIEEEYGPPRAYEEKQQAEQRTKRQQQKKQDGTATEKARQNAQEARRAQIVVEVDTIIVRARKSGSAPVLAALAAFDAYYRTERATRVNGVTNPRLRDLVVRTWETAEKRVEQCLVFFTRVYPEAGQACPVPELAEWLANHPVSEWKPLFQ